MANPHGADVIDGFKAIGDELVVRLKNETFSEPIDWSRRYVLDWNAEKTFDLKGYVVPVYQSFGEGTRAGPGRVYRLGVYLIQSFSVRDYEATQARADQLNRLLDEVETLLMDARLLSLPSTLVTDQQRVAVDQEAYRSHVYFSGVAVDVKDG